MYTKEDIEKAKQYLDNEGYETGSNFTLNAVANLIAEYAAKNCVIPAVMQRSEQLSCERCKKLEFMIKNGLGWKDMDNDALSKAIVHNVKI